VDCFEAYERLNPHVACDDRQLADVVGLALQAKKWFIEIDEFDRAERLVLNFGHTFGHALEAASAFRVSHGIAVGLGMLAAINLGAAMGRDYSNMPHVGRFCDHIRTLLAAVDGLDDAIADVSVDRLLDAFNSDKKHGRAQYAVIAVNGAGVPERVLLPRDASSTALVAEAFRTTLAQPMFAAV
jgi:3-dehydroquinate synthase